jgi:hypothetical protein
MRSFSRNGDCERLEQELNTEEYQTLFTGLQRGTPFLRQFGEWSDVIAFMRSGSVRDPRKDEILRPIFLAHAKDQDPRWLTVLLVICWHGLEAMDFKRRHWDVDARERWQNVMWSFLKVVSHMDVQRRPDQLAQKLFNDTGSRLHGEYRRIWTRANREIATDHEPLKELAGGSEDIDISGIDCREARQTALQSLRAHLEAGRISEADFLLLVGTRVYEQSLADYAREAGLSYQVAKKRRQRAEAAYRLLQRSR